jgi:hypothetical protein
MFLCFAVIVNICEMTSLFSNLYFREFVVQQWKGGIREPNKVDSSTKKPRLSSSSEIKEGMGVELERSNEGGGINEDHAQYPVSMTDN